MLSDAELGKLKGVTWYPERVSELDVHAATLIESLVRHGHVELADDFGTWWYENRPETEDDL